MCLLNAQNKLATAYFQDKDPLWGKIVKKRSQCNAKKTTKTKKKEDPDQMGGGTEPGSLKN